MKVSLPSDFEKELDIAAPQTEAEREELDAAWEKFLRRLRDEDNGASPAVPRNEDEADAERHHTPDAS